MQVQNRKPQPTIEMPKKNNPLNKINKFKNNKIKLKKLIKIMKI